LKGEEKMKRVELGYDAGTLKVPLVVSDDDFDNLEQRLISAQELFKMDDRLSAKGVNYLTIKQFSVIPQRELGKFQTNCLEENQDLVMEKDRISKVLDTIDKILAGKYRIMVTGRKKYMELKK